MSDFTPVFSMPVNRLAPLVGAVEKTVQRRNTIPILSNVLLKLDAGEVSVTATDLDCWSTASDGGAEGEGGFEAALPAFRLSAFLKNLPQDGRLSLASDGGCNVRLSCGRARATIPTLPASDFPSMPKPPAAQEMAFPASELRRMMQKCSVSISHEETRYYLTGICLVREEDTLSAVATDGHKLSLVTTAGLEGDEAVNRQIIPRKACEQLSAMAEKAEIVHLAISETALCARVSAGGGERVFHSKLIDGTFPDFRRVIPSAWEREWKVDRAALLAAVDRVVSAGTGERDKALKLVFSGETLTLTQNFGGDGDASDAVDAVALKTEADFEIGINSTYLREVVSVAGGNEIALQMSNAGDPVRIVDPAGDGSELFIVMPMRV